MSIEGMPVRISNPATSPAQFIPKDEPMELCREYMRQRAWMVARVRGIRATEEDVQNTLNRLFQESEPPRRPAPRDASVPEGFERTPNGFITVAKELNTVEINTTDPEKNFIMWNKLMLYSAILLVIVNICVAIFSPKLPIGFIPLVPFLFTLYKRNRAYKRHMKSKFDID